MEIILVWAVELHLLIIAILYTYITPTSNFNIRQKRLFKAKKGCFIINIMEK